MWRQFSTVICIYVSRLLFLTIASLFPFLLAYTLSLCVCLYRLSCWSIFVVCLCLRASQVYIHFCGFCHWLRSFHCVCFKRAFLARRERKWVKTQKYRDFVYWLLGILIHFVHSLENGCNTLWVGVSKLASLAAMQQTCN